MYNSFHKQFLFHLDLCCSLTISKIKYIKITWVTHGIPASREKLNIFHSIYIQTASNDYKQFYENDKQIYNNFIKAAKANDIQLKLKTSNGSKTAWFIINQYT